jgi:two-component system chemotaxis sensor kinase CheA
MTPEEIQGIFFVECEESLAAAEQGLAACKAGTQDADTVNAIFRAVHSIKGGAGAFGFEALQAFTHTFETLLSDVREDQVPITPALIDLLLRARCALRPCDRRARRRHRARGCRADPRAGRRDGQERGRPARRRRSAAPPPLPAMARSTRTN